MQAPTAFVENERTRRAQGADTTLGPFVLPDGFERTQTRLFRSLVTLLPFWTEQTLRDVLVPYLTGRSRVSLRALDWLVTNHAKKYQIVCAPLSSDSVVRLDAVDVHRSYDDWLRNYRRRGFDAFRRSRKIAFDLSGARHYTTVGQLNFFYWAHTHGVLAYAEAHAAEIVEEMRENTRYLRETHDILRRVKRREITPQPASSCTVYEIAGEDVLGFAQP